VWRRHRQLLLYGMIGCSGIALDLLVFAVLFNLAGVPAQVANAISLSAGITNNFLLNSRFNFRARDGLFRRFVRFYGVGLVGMAMVVVALFVFATLGGLDPNLVKACSVPGVVAFQYWANSRWSFREAGLGSGADGRGELGDDVLGDLQQAHRRG